MLSIITPVLNGAKFIRNNIESIQNLRVPFEHIIVDGGSIDNTIEIVKEYSNVKLLKQNEKSGMYGAIDQGFKVAKFDYISWINCDDTIFPENFQKAILLAYENNFDFIYGDAYNFYSNENKLKVLKANKYARFFLKKGILPFVQPSSLYKRDIYNHIKLNYQDFKICGDLDFFMRIAFEEKAVFFYYKQILTTFLYYGESLGDRNVSQYLDEQKKLLKTPNYFDRFLFKVSKIF